MVFPGWHNVTDPNFISLGVETWNTLWLVWDTYNYPGCDFPEHQKESGLADNKDDGERFHCLCHGMLQLCKFGLHRIKSVSFQSKALNIRYLLPDITSSLISDSNDKSMGYQWVINWLVIDY